MSYAEFLAFCDSAETKHEYEDGVAVAMTGGSPEHGRLAVAFASLLTNALEGRPCRVFSSDVRVRIEETNRALYPDLSVVCGNVETASDDEHGVTNPSVIVEVLSPRTEANDRGAKFASYRRLPTLQEYVLVSQNESRMEVFRREGDHWSLYEFGSGESLVLTSLSVSIPIDLVYRDRID